MEKISACLIVLNEEKLIGRCLESLRGVVDEIILVHDGECLDKTLEIARTFGAKIYVRPHQGYCEEHRAFAWREAKNNWILQIDADEFLAPELKDKLPALIADSSVAAYELLWPLWDGNKENKALWPRKRCLFRKDKISFLGILHYIINVDGKIKRVNLKLNHRPAYNNFSYSSFFQKQLPWARLQAESYFRDFSEISKFNYLETDWPRVIKWRKRFPRLIMPLDFLSASFGALFSGAYHAGGLGFKISLRAGLYRTAVDYYIYKFKQLANKK